MKQITENLRETFYDSYNMLHRLLEACPDELWKNNEKHMPFWNQIVHSLMGCDYWLRLDYSIKHRYLLELPDSLRELSDDEWHDIKHAYLSKTQAKDYFKAMDQKMGKFFDMLDDKILCDFAWSNNKFTYYGVISEQIRHIMCHVGMCNLMLMDNGFDEIKWLANGKWW